MRVSQANGEIRRARVALVLVLSVLVAWVITTRSVKPPIKDDYENYAFALAEWGVFANARSTTEAPQPGIGRAPLYPLFLAGLMLADDRDLERGRCYVEKRDQCKLTGGLVPYVQIIMSAISVVTIFEIALMLSASAYAAIAVTALSAWPILRLTYEYQVSEGIALPLFGLASLFLALWFSGRAKYFILILLGVTMGLLALTRVAYIYFLPPIFAVVVLVPAAARAVSWKSRLAAGSLLVASFAATVAPWYARNFTLVGAPAIGDSGVAGVLTQRISYNRMTLTEGAAATVFFIPTIGKPLARIIFDPEIIAKFDFENPRGFRQQGWQLLDQQQKLYPKAAEQRAALAREMLSSPMRHLLVAIPLTVDGMSDMFWLLPFAAVGFFAALRGNHYWIMPAMTLTACNLFFHAAATHFRSRYGLPMLFGIAPLAAVGLTVLFEKLSAILNLRRRNASLAEQPAAGDK